MKADAGLKAMVKEIKKNRKTLYLCGECGMAYAEKKWAEKCEAYCQKHPGCNLEIIEHAVPLD